MAAEDSNFEDVLTLAAQGDLESIFSVGVHYLSGDGVTKKKEERRSYKMVRASCQ